MNKEAKKLVYVAMSGGVDSSVAAALLKKRGFDVVGVFFKPWSPSAEKSYCNWQQDRQDAMRVASILDIPFKTWDFSKEYGRKVTKYMIDGYKKGETPNPDVMCNKEIKFGLFLNKALSEGADFIATGHYAKVKISKSDAKLLKGEDENKDQSYFLWTLTQKQLKYCLFPIGEYTKPEVRKMARKFGLPTYAKKDSQGVCFVGELNMKDFLKEYIPSKRGKIVLLETGKVIGEHDGAGYYTIGQRHGMNITVGGGPYFVANKDMKKNLIFVVKDETKLNKKEIEILNTNWILSPKENMQVKIRYRSKAISGKLQKQTPSGVVFRLTHSARAVTPGQSAVFYKGEMVLGGGIIK